MSNWNFLRTQVTASYDAAGRPRRVLAAVSGGADSMALLEILADMRADRGFFLAVAHVNHGLRPEAGAEAVMVEARCKALQVPCEVRKVRLKSAGEDDARQARYEALFALSRELEIDALALAHHRQDQAETLLMHLIRGSGSHGLAAMRACARRTMEDDHSVLLWRPFLNVPPENLRSILTERGVLWAEDQSNQDTRYLRNFFRRDILPRIRERLPSADSGIARAAEILSAEDDLLHAMARDFVDRHGHDSPCRCLEREPFQLLHPALQRRALRAFCPVPLDFEITERLRSCAAGDAVNLPGGWRAQATGKWLHLLPPAQKRPERWEAAVLKYQGAPGDGISYQAVPRALFEKCVLRFRQPGDRIRPLGGPGEKSLQDFLVDRKIDRPFRDHVPLLCVENKVIWAVGIGPGEEARVAQDSDAVLLKYLGNLPWGGIR